MLRIILCSIFSIFLYGCQTIEKEESITNLHDSHSKINLLEGNAKMANEQFIIAGGDGDQDVLGRQLKLVRVYPDWFDGKVYRGEDQAFVEDAYLLKVISGDKYDARLIAITSRWVMGLDDQFHENGGASAIIHLVDSNFDNSRITSMNSSAVGMAFIDKY